MLSASFLVSTSCSEGGASDAIAVQADPIDPLSAHLHDVNTLNAGLKANLSSQATCGTVPRLLVPSKAVRGSTKSGDWENKLCVAIPTILSTTLV